MTESAFRDELARLLPELRTQPGFPHATDEAILVMSLPPTYTASPNPFIRDWLKASEPPGQSNLVYEDPGPFIADISVGKGHPLYKAHGFHTKVPHQAIMRYLLHYTRPGDVVLDGFCGTGMTGVAAQICANPEPSLRQEIEAEMGPVEWGARRAILQDLSPAATFIAAGLNLPIDAAAFEWRSREILDEFEAEWSWMYETHHSNGEVARIDYTIWSEIFTCPHCGGEVVFYDAAFSPRTKKVQADFSCPVCGAHLTKTTLERRLVTRSTLASDIINRVEVRPVRIAYRYGQGRYEKPLDDNDWAVLRRVASVLPSWFPTQSLHVERLWHGYNFGPRGLSHVHHLWSDRSLISLADIWRRCTSEPNPVSRLALLFWAEQAIWGLSWMNRYRPEGFSQVAQFQSGVYYFPALATECSPRYNLEGTKPLRGKRKSLASTWSRFRPDPNLVRISTGSSTTILVDDETVDYIFVDPPFGLNIPYTDLNLPVEMWHGVVADNTEEAVIHRVRGVGLAQYRDLLEGCFTEFYRILKSGRWMTVEFSNSSNAVWMALQEAMSSAGFVVADTRILDKEQHSWIQVRRPNAVKHDIILSAYKPDSEAEERFSIVAGSEEGAWEFVREHLRHVSITEGLRGGGQIVRERQADRLYDRMVAFHVHRGATVPITTAQFYVGLERRFPVRDDMYFLEDQVEVYERHRLTLKELAQADLFITNEASAIQWLRQRLKKRSQTFANIQPPFFAELQAGLPDWEDLPDLRQILEENFLQHEDKRWYVPDPRSLEDLEKLRRKSLLREFESYTTSRGKLERFRSEAIRAGFKEAWERRDHPRIVSIGRRLPNEILEEDETIFYYFSVAERQGR